MGGFAGAPNSLLYRDDDLTDKSHGELSAIDVTAPYYGVQDMRFSFGPNGAGSVPVPDGHYLSSIWAISRYQDVPRGLLTNDLLRSVWFGFRYKPDAFDKKAG
jgi:hypothetical protein